MPRPHDAKSLQAEFARSYQLGCCPALLDLEQRVQGCDYGATSWTTRDEANAIAARLKLGPGIRLLDVGAGAGWPGLYFAQITGCDVILTDVPLEALRNAAGRASRDGLGNRCAAVVAAGARLPLQDNCMDAINHSDVLCCLSDKLDTLRECRRVARTGAPMAFSIIRLEATLSDSERAIALAGAPVFVETPLPYAVLLQKSGWQLEELLDLTAQFARSARALIDGIEALAPELAKLFGQADYAERLAKRQATLLATNRGLLRRELFLCAAR